MTDDDISTAAADAAAAMLRPKPKPLLRSYEHERSTSLFDRRTDPMDMLIDKLIDRLEAEGFIRADPEKKDDSDPYDGLADDIAEVMYTLDELWTDDGWRDDPEKWQHLHDVVKDIPA